MAGKVVHSNTIPDDNREAIIVMVNVPMELELDVSGAVDHGAGLFVVPFYLRAQSLLGY